MGSEGRHPGMADGEFALVMSEAISINGREEDRGVTGRESCAAKVVLNDHKRRCRRGHQGNLNGPENSSKGLCQTYPLKLKDHLERSMFRMRDHYCNHCQCR